MKKFYSLFFIRHGKLLLPYKDHNEMPFEVIADLASEKLNPSIDKKFTLVLIKGISTIIPFKNLEKIYSSPSKRCQETAALVANFIDQNFKKRIRIVTIPELREVSLDLNKLYPSLPKDLSIEKVNNKVFSAMITGQNCESITDTYERVGSIFGKIDKSEVSLSITQDFLMRVIEIYIRNRGKSNPVITYKTLKKTKRNLYLHGFATDASLSKLISF